MSIKQFLIAGITEVETIGIDTPQDLEKAEEFLKIC